MTFVEHPKVSVIMNCFNGEEYLKQALDSVFGQTYDDWEIVFWDNASTDQSAAIAKSYGERVRYFKSSVTSSLGKARNLAIKESRGEFIAFLDCDDIWLPRKLEKQMPLFEKDPLTALVFSDMVVFDNEGDICQYLRENKPPRGMVFRELFVNYFIGILSVVILKSTLEHLECFDERFENIEDMDLFLRISYSFKLDYIDEPLVKWRLHDGSQTFRKFGLFATEWDLLLEKLTGLYPDFKKNYAKEVRGYVSKTNQLRVLGEWLNYRPVSARKLLSNEELGILSRLGYFCLTLLPPAIFFPLSKLRYRLKGMVAAFRSHHR